MDRIEKFIASTLNKEYPEPVELYCKEIYECILIRHVKALTIDDFNYTLNMRNVFKETVQQLMQNELCIICLNFKDSVIYVNQSKILNIQFFKIYFKDNDTNDLIIDLPMHLELSHHKIMKKVIHFLNYGYIRGEHKLDITAIYQLALINDYLLEVISEDNIQYNSTKNSLSSVGIINRPITLKKYLVNIIENRLVFFTDDIKNYHVDIFNMIYQLFFLLKLNHIILSVDIILKYKEDLLKSKLFIKSTFEFQARILENFGNPFPLEFVNLSK